MTLRDTLKHMHTAYTLTYEKYTHVLLLTTESHSYSPRWPKVIAQASTVEAHALPHCVASINFMAKIIWSQLTFVTVAGEAGLFGVRQFHPIHPSVIICVCMCLRWLSVSIQHTYTYTHSHPHTSTYVHIYDTLLTPERSLWKCQKCLIERLVTFCIIKHRPWYGCVCLVCWMMFVMLLYVACVYTYMLIYVFIYKLALSDTKAKRPDEEQKRKKNEPRLTIRPIHTT